MQFSSVLRPLWFNLMPMPVFKIIVAQKPAIAPIFRAKNSAFKMRILAKQPHIRGISLTPWIVVTVRSWVQGLEIADT